MSANSDQPGFFSELKRRNVIRVATAYVVGASRRADFPEAERLVRKALELDPFNADWRNDLASILYELGRKDKALPYLRRTVELEPDGSFSLYALGLLDIRDGHTERALERWQRAYPVLTASDDPEIGWNNLREGMYFAGILMEAGEA